MNKNERLDPRKYRQLYEIDAEFLLEKKKGVLPPPPPYIGCYLGPALKSCREHLIKETVPGRKFLDVGCGSGDLTRFASKVRARVSIGIDIATSIVRYARNESNRRAEFTVADAQNLPFKNNQFDTILCTEVLEHIPNPMNTLKELYRVLNANGTVIITTPNEERLSKKIPRSIKRILGARETSEIERYKKYAKKMERKMTELGVKTHENCFSPDLLYRLLSDSKFKNIKIRGVGLLVPPVIINRFPKSAKFFITLDRVLSHFKYSVYFMWNIVATAEK